MYMLHPPSNAIGKLAVSMLVVVHVWLFALDIDWIFIHNISVSGLCTVLPYLVLTMFLVTTGLL